MNFYLLCLKNRDPNKILAQEIMKVEGLDFNHVEILMEYSDKVGISFGAVYPKSRWCALGELEKTYEIVDKIPLQITVSEEEAQDYLWNMCGKPYSPLQLVIIYLKLKLSRFSKWLAYVKLNLKAALICTEEATDFMVDCCSRKVDISTETVTLREAVAIAKNEPLTNS